jgi:hypothetical protein
MSSYTAIDSSSCNDIDSPSVITSFVCCSRRINPYSVFNYTCIQLQWRESGVVEESASSSDGN